MMMIVMRILASVGGRGDSLVAVAVAVVATLAALALRSVGGCLISRMATSQKGGLDLLSCRGGMEEEGGGVMDRGLDDFDWDGFLLHP